MINAMKKPISINIVESRWRLFGHILRRDIDIPANKAMKAFFVPKGDKFRGRLTTTLPTVINKDLIGIPARPFEINSRR